MNNPELYLAGGKLEISLLNSDGTINPNLKTHDVNATEIELSREIKTATAFSPKMGLNLKVSEVVTEKNYTLKWKTNSYDAKNIMLALGGNIKEKIYNVNEVLPNGESAKGGESWSEIVESSEVLNAALKFISAPVSGKQVVLEIGSASIKSSSSLKYISQEFGSIDFEASLNVVGSESPYKHYIKNTEALTETEDIEQVI